MNPAIAQRVHCRVWWADIRHRSVYGLIGVLSEVELKRAAQFHREQDRRRFVTGCWLLRTVAAAELGTTPDAVPIDRWCDRCGEPHGKPRIVTPVRLEASVSHSGTRIGVALSGAGQVGLDVEEIVPMSDGIPWNALSPAEQATLRGLPERDQTPEFLRMWICKEAVLKATGHGLRIPPDQVEVSGPGEKPALRRWPLDVPPESVTLHTLDPGHGYIGVAALLSGGEVVKVSEADAQLLSPEREAA